MPHPANITQSRFHARTLYVVKAAYRHLQDGAVKLLLGPKGNAAFTGTLASCNNGNQGFIFCPDLYTRTSPALPQLPLQFGDQLEYDVVGNQIRILAIRRSGGKATLGIQPSSRSTLSSRVTPAQFAPATTNGILPSYISLNAARIAHLSPQVLGPWNSRYDGWSQGVMLRLYRMFPNKLIQRSDVVRLYRRWADSELALVATMVWGGIKIADLQALLVHGPATLVGHMNHLRGLVHSGHLHQAFLDCSVGGCTKLSGVGFAFFTKIFFFIGQATPRLKLKPLILDRWTSNAFFLCLMQQAGIHAAKQHFRLPGRSNFNLFPSIPLRSTTRLQAATYVHYVTQMNSWAAAIPAPIGPVPAAQLEQFLFGQSRKLNRHPANPRSQIIQLITPLLPPP